MRKILKILTGMLVVLFATVALVGCNLGESDITKITASETEVKVGLEKEVQVQLDVLGVGHKDKVKATVENKDIVSATVGEKDVLTLKGLKIGTSKVTLTPTKKNEDVKLELNVTVEESKPVTAIADVAEITLTSLERSKSVDLEVTPDDFNEQLEVQSSDQKLTVSVKGNKLTVATEKGGYTAQVTITAKTNNVVKTVDVKVETFGTKDIVDLPTAINTKVGETPMQLLKSLPMDHTDELAVASSDQTVATAKVVLKNTLRVEALKEGSTTLTITSPDNQELSKTINVVVAAADTVDPCVGVTDTEITVGNTAATTGAYAGVGVPFNAGIKAVFDEVNALGGIHGRTINFVHNDDAGNSTNGTTYVTDMLATSFAIVGNFAGTVEPTVPIIAGQNKIMFYAANGTKALYNEDAKDGHEGIFSVQPVSIMDGRFMLARAVATKLYGANKDQGLPADAKIGVIHTDNQGEKEMVEGVKKEATNRSIDASRLIVKQVNLSDETNITAAVNDLKSKGVQVIVLAASQPTFKAVIPKLIDVESTIPVFTSYFNADASVFGENKVKFRTFANSWIDLYAQDSVVELQEYLQFLARTKNMDYATNAFFSAGYIAGTMFVQALLRTGRNVTTASFIAAQEAQGSLKIPMGGSVVLKDGTKSRRVGTEDMGLVEFKDATKSKTGKPAFEKFADLTQISALQ